jgi:glycerophosphoryl diester phosphodiesterase
MGQRVITLTFAVVLSASVGLAVAVAERGSDKDAHDGREYSVQLGPRPLFLVNDMQESRLKRELLSCSDARFTKTDFSIGHRGAALQFPEHTKESYEAGARMGAGILECDVTFTKDLELVCRHAQNDLHTTTNILVTPLASQCTKPFTPAQLGPAGNLITPATAECRTSDITLAEFKTMTGKMDASNPRHGAEVAPFCVGALQTSDGMRWRGIHARDQAAWYSCRERRHASGLQCARSSVG